MPLGDAENKISCEVFDFHATYSVVALAATATDTWLVKACQCTP